MLTLEPAQTVVDGLTVTLMLVGTGFTVTVTCPVVAQVALLAVTIYVVVLEGVTDTDVPLKEPGVHV